MEKGEVIGMVLSRNCEVELKGWLEAKNRPELLVIFMSGVPWMISMILSGIVIAAKTMHKDLGRLVQLYAELEVYV